MTFPTAPRLIVYYDGGCAVCSREIGFYQRLRGADQLDWVDAAHCAPGALGVDLSRAAALARLHVRAPNGRLLSGARLRRAMVYPAGYSPARTGCRPVGRGACT